MSEKQRRLYDRRRALGQCVECAEPSSQYARCLHCRIERTNAQTARRRLARADHQARLASIRHRHTEAA